MFLVRLQPARVREIGSLGDRAPHLSRLESKLSTWQPAIELENRENELILRIALPGFQRDDLEIQAARNAIAIAGDRTPTERSLYKSEFRYGRFERLVRLPVPIDNTQIRAELSNGILSLNLPKVGVIRNRAVKVNLTRSMPEQWPHSYQEEPEELEASSLELSAQQSEEISPIPSAQVALSVVNDETDDVWTAHSGAMDGTESGSQE
jgi:HSP20 family protein